MNKKFLVFILGLCLMSFTACGNNNSNNESGNNDLTGESNSEIESEQDIQEDDNEENKTAVLDSSDGLVIVPGIYDVGDYIDSADYLITCDEADYSMKIVVFENKDSYNNYQNSNRVTNGEELAAIEKNALYDCYLQTGEVGYLSLKSGYVLLIDDGNGHLSDYNVQDSSDMELYGGIYFIDDDFDAAQYLFTCADTDYSMQAIVFESMDQYKSYHQTSRFSNGEESAAIEQNALYDYYLETDEMGYLGLRAGYVLYIKDGMGKLSKIPTQESDGNTAWYSDSNIGLPSGVYFADDDLEAAQYSLTCVTSYMQVIVFESIDTYKAYHQMSRFTNGEESDAIEQNAITSEYMYEGDNLAVRLQNGNVLMIKDGAGTLTVLSK